MKKQFTNLALLIFFAIGLLSSCNKADIKHQPLPPPESEADGASGTRTSCGCCPSVVPEATSISYSLNIFYPEVGIAVDVFYTNPEADGTLKVVLRTANDSIYATDIVDAPLLDPGQTGVIHLDYSVPQNDFPCTLHVHGRPLNLDCDMRMKKTFTIVNQVSRTR